MVDSDIVYKMIPVKVNLTVSISGLNDYRAIWSFHGPGNNYLTAVGVVHVGVYIMMNAYFYTVTRLVI